MTPRPVDLGASQDIRVIPIPAPAVRVRVERRAAPPPAAADRPWKELCSANPRLHDSPILSVVGLDAGAGELACEICGYKAFVTAPRLGLRVWALGVTGVLWKAGPRGPHALFGRRAANVRIYADLWETAPRGAARAPAAPASLSPGFLEDELRHEALEELGAEFPVPMLRPIAAVIDPVASSVDIVYAGEVSSATALTPASWEYSALEWRDLSPASGPTLTPPTAALAAAVARGELALTSAART